MSVAQLEQAAVVLGDLRSEAVFVGGATIGLWITDQAAPPARPTIDVDLVVAVTTRRDLEAFDLRLAERGVHHDLESRSVCRRRHAETGLLLDVMSLDATMLGFDGVWQGRSVEHAVLRTLPSGLDIRVATPSYLLAMKLEAFRGRGEGDLLGSRDFADIIALVDGRAELVGDVAEAGDGVRTYVAREVAALLAMPRIDDGLHGALPGDAGARVDAVVRPALLALSEQAETTSG